MFAELGSLLGRTVLAPDLPGHGKTTVTPVTLDATVDALAEWLEEAGFEGAPMVGYSQGGRVALHLALARPGLVGALILVSTSPGIAPEHRPRRREEELVMAARIEKVGLPRFLDVWLDQPTIGTTRVEHHRRRADRALREQNTAAGLADALRGMGQGSHEDLRQRLADLAMPVLCVVGENDAKFGGFAAEIAGSTGAEVVTIANSTHNVILEQPDLVSAAIEAFLS